MRKEYLEALNKIQHDFGQLKGQELVSCYEIIFNALKRLEAIDNSNPSEALECLEKLKGMEISSMPFSDEYGTQEVDLNDIRKVGSQLNTDFREYTTTIKQALLKAQKSLKALDIIKEKYVHIPQLLCAFENQLEEENPLEVYYNGQVGINVPMPLTEEEFNLLKEVLE